MTLRYACACVLSWYGSVSAGLQIHMSTVRRVIASVEQKGLVLCTIVLHRCST